ncbi:O-antigen ligase family protein [Mucilaginibacter calamicampi]|uniref:O-antigen ligase family protein n=1 Tax=Mucilaginibacter calamicampi TaxID=1302352 RepID=A0ABW2YYV5_9SPHI
MTDLLRPNNSLTNRISYWHLLLLLASLPFDRFFSHVILISFALHLLIHLHKPLFKPLDIVLTSAFFVTLISTLYTTNLPGAYSELALDIPILIIPMLFCLATVVLKQYRDKLLQGFTWVCVATVVYLYADAIRLIKYYQLPYSAIFSAAFTNHNFSAPIDMHATFFAMQIAIALVYVIAYLIREKSKYGLYIPCALILVAGLMQLCSKSVFFALLLIVNIAIPCFLLQQKKRWRYIAATAAISVLLLAVVFSIGTLRTRYITDLSADLSHSASGQLLDSRMARWSVVTNVIKQSPVFGHGAGTETAILHEQFFKQKYYSSFLKNLNAHNQYLSFLFKSGIWGLLTYLGTLVYGFNKAIKRKDLLFFTFMLLVSLISLSENLLDVDKGVFFYGIFFSFFAFSATKSDDAFKPVSV